MCRKIYKMGAWINTEVKRKLTEMLAKKACWLLYTFRNSFAFCLTFIVTWLISILMQVPLTSGSIFSRLSRWNWAPFLHPQGFSFHSLHTFPWFLAKERSVAKEIVTYNPQRSSTYAGSILITGIQLWRVLKFR